MPSQVWSLLLAPFASKHTVCCSFIHQGNAMYNKLKNTKNGVQITVCVDCMTQQTPDLRASNLPPNATFQHNYSVPGALECCRPEFGNHCFKPPQQTTYHPSLPSHGPLMLCDSKQIQGGAAVSVECNLLIVLRVMFTFMIKLGFLCLCVCVYVYVGVCVCVCAHASL